MSQQTCPHVQRPIHHGEARDLARTAYRRLADIVEVIGPDEWARPTDCTGWSVRDLVGHLVGAMRSAASLREMASQQLEVRRRAARHGGDQTDIMTQIQIERTASLTTPALVAECRALVEPAAAGRHRTPAIARRLVRFPVELRGGTETWNLGYLVDVILTRDAWLHRIDLCRALGHEPVLTADHDGRLVADVVAEWARRHAQPFHLVLTGPAGGEFERHPDPPEAKVERLDMDAVDFCRILSGRAHGTGLLATEIPF